LRGAVVVPAHSPGCRAQNSTHAAGGRVKRGNWIQTIPGKGWFTILRLYSPLEPFFAKTWRPSDLFSDTTTVAGEVTFRLPQLHAESRSFRR
jgi:hypothetical protein